VLEVYDPLADIWSEEPSMPTPRGGSAAVAYLSRLYVFGGEEPGGTFDENEEYDPTTKQWREALVMSTARHGLGAAVVDGAVYVIGGGKRPALSVSNVNERYTITFQQP